MKINQDGVIAIRKSRGDKAASILITGDCCPRANGETLILNGEAESILEPVQDIFMGADLSIMQFETPLTTDNTPIVKSGPNLRCHPDTIDFLHAWGGDVTLLANNHIGDFGEKAVLETIDILNQNGFKTVGAGANLEDAYKPLLFEANGILIGILNFAENEFGSAGPMKAGAAPLNPCRNIRQIRELSRKVDICMVVTHGGNETNPVPSPRVVEMSRAFVDAGAKIVVNIHTHCPQGIEIYNKAPIVYSLGNFYFPWPTERKYSPGSFWLLGYLVKFQIDEKGVCALEAIPTRFEQDGSSVTPLTAKQNAGFYKYLQKLSDILVDWSRVVAFHEAWAANSGYAQNLVHYPFKAEYFEQPAPCRELMALRNLLTCEAHNEVLKTYMRLVEEGRLEQALKWMPELQKMMEATFLEE